MSRLVDFFREVLGIEPWPEQAAILTEYEEKQPSELVLCCGRRSGKSTLAAGLALFHAVTAPVEPFLRPQEPHYVLIVATSQEQAGIIHATVRSLLDRPQLAGLLVSSTSDELWLAAGAHPVCIRTMAANSRSTRGYAASLIIMDEVGHMLDEVSGAAAARKIYQALAPSTAQFGDAGRLLMLSTPLYASGLFFDHYQRATAGSDPKLLAIQRSTQQMNPTISESWLERQRLLDPVAYQVEYEATFSSALAAYLDADAIAACIDPGVRERPPKDGWRYAVAVDPAYVGDAFAAVVLGRKGDELEVACLRQWRGSQKNPVQHTLVCVEIAELAKQYHHAKVTTDQFAAQPVKQALEALHVDVAYQPWTSDSKRSAFATLKAQINTGSISLLDHPQLRGELLALESRAAPSGRPRIAARAGSHDDLATALAAAVAMLEPRHATTGLLDDSALTRGLEWGAGQGMPAGIAKMALHAVAAAQAGGDYHSPYDGLWSGPSPDPDDAGCYDVAMAPAAEQHHGWDFGPTKQAGEL